MATTHVTIEAPARLVVTVDRGQSSSPRQKPFPVLSLESWRRSNRFGLSRQRRESEEAAGSRMGQSMPGTVQSTSVVQSTDTVQDHPPLDYLEHDHITVETLGLSQETAEAMGSAMHRRA
jgi:hypothetical protein